MIAHPNTVNQKHNVNPTVYNEVQHCTSTGSLSLDRLLDGGIHSGQVIEVSGPPGIGKSQLGMQCVANLITNHANVECVYIDTEGGLSLERLEVLITASMVTRKVQIPQPPLSFNNQNEHYNDHHRQQIMQCLDRIHTFSISNYLEQVACVELLYGYLRRYPQIKLVVLDSVSFHFRQGLSDVKLRTRLLGGMSASLNKCVEKHKVAVLVTNQMTTKYQKDAHPKRETTVLVPSLGESWGNGCTHRLLFYWKEGVRTAVSTKAPIRKEGTVPFAITPSGIRDVADRSSTTPHQTHGPRSRPPQHREPPTPPQQHHKSPVPRQ
ncbi:hypothetical protein SeMB42_g05269 [Synchytrium endobioticum]|uniref:DNA repair protein RAD51 homolog 3 n=1 Tax=Synchytrium endobioticum TaxID=286115 RepID=A0A507CRN9_9FUNG|nr:hypothetical protein SeLEV6574_g05906 [Synchytrium endobioticum]TPX42121.1 hypothetical protein SeMB42_g05269 [Synchytrium endobioticum]